MASKSKAPKKIPPTLKKAAGNAGNVIKKVFGKGKGKGKKHKKSAFWYAKEIQRIKLKRRYEKVKYGVGR